MDKNATRFRQFLWFILPTGIGIVVYIALSALTLWIHSFPRLQQYLDISGRFEFKKAVLDSLNNWLTSVFGVSFTNALVLGMFWAFIGIAVYIFIESMLTVLLELDESIKERKFIEPRGADRNSTLKDLIRRILFRLVMAIILIFYIDIFLGFFLKGQVSSRGILGIWLNQHQFIKGTVLFVGGCFALHGAAVLIRLLLLKRRILRI